MAYLLLSANLVVGIPWILSTIIAVATRIEREEAMMIAFIWKLQVNISPYGSQSDEEYRMLENLELDP